MVDEGPHALYHSHRLSGDTLLVVLDSVMNDIADTRYPSFVSLVSYTVDRFYERSAQYKWLNTTVMEDCGATSLRMFLVRFGT